MGALTRVVAASIAAAAIAVAAVLLVGRSVPAHAVQPSAPLVVRASFDPPVVQFGDRVVARVVVLADRAVVDAADLRITAGLAPLAQLATPHVTRSVRGRLAVVTYEVPAVCIDDGCLAGKGPRRLRLAPVRVDARRAHVVARWPLLDVRPRVGAADLASGRPAFRVDTSYPVVTYRVSPGTLTLLLDVLAALLAAAGAAWATWQIVLRGRRRRALDTRSELERAIALVREAEDRSADDRRRAVGLLARVVRKHDTGLAHDAGELAWSRPRPEPAALDALAERAAREESAR
jgi:hypothetical protein